MKNASSVLKPSNTTKNQLGLALAGCAVLLIATSSWNLLSFSKISGLASSKQAHTTANQYALEATTAPSNGMQPSTATPTTGTTTTPTEPSVVLSPDETIKAGIREIATSGIDPFSVALVAPKMGIKTQDLKQLNPFYQLLISHNKDIQIISPPKPVTPTGTNPMAGGLPGEGGIGTPEAPPIVNPIGSIRLSGVSYMPKRSYAMLNIAGGDSTAANSIVAVGQVITVNNEPVKVMSISRGKAKLMWLAAPKGFPATQEITVPDIIGYTGKDATTDTNGGGSNTSASNGTSPSAVSVSYPSAGMPTFKGGNVPSKSSTAGNSPEAIEQLVNEAMKKPGQ